MADTVSTAQRGFLTSALSGSGNLELSTLAMECYERLIASGFTIAESGAITLTVAPTFSGANLTALNAANISTGTLAVARGGTGLASYTTGDLLYASAATTLAKLAGVATGSVLVSGGVGTAPAWSATPTATSWGIADSNASHFLRLLTTSDLTADRNLTLVTGDAARTVTLSGNPTLSDWFDQSVKTTAMPTFAAVTSTGTLNIGNGAATSIVQFGGANVLSTNAAGNTIRLNETGYGTIEISGGGNGIKFAQNVTLMRNTSDGSDNGSVAIAGGGAGEDTSRGAFIRVNGNEFSGAGGWAIAQVGNVGGAAFEIRRADTTAALNVLGSDGSATFTTSADPGVTINNTNASQGGILIQKSGASRGQIGFGFSSAGTADLLVGASAGTLFLEGSAGAIAANFTAVTTGSAANVFIDSGTGVLARSTSSARYKTAIRPLEDWRWLLRITPVSFASKGDPTGRRFGGLLAEDIAAHGPTNEAGVPLYAGLDADGRPDDVAYAHLTAPIIKAIHELSASCSALAARVSALEQRAKGDEHTWL